MNPICTFAEADMILGYKSRSTLYRLKRDGWLDDYLVKVNGKDMLKFQPRGKQKLSDHIMGIIQWWPSNPIREQNFETL